MQSKEVGPYLAEASPGWWATFFSIAPWWVYAIVAVLIIAGFVSALSYEYSPLGENLHIATFAVGLLASAVTVMSLLAALFLMHPWELRTAEGLSQHYGVEIDSGILYKEEVLAATEASEPSYVVLPSMEAESVEKVSRNPETGHYKITETLPARNPELYLFIDGSVLELMTKSSDEEFIPYSPPA